MPSIAKNFVYNLGLSVANLLFPIVSFIYVSRVIGPEGLGKVNFAISVASYFIIFGAFGMSSYGVRAIASVRQDKAKLEKTFNELFCINVVTVAITCLAYALLIVLLPKARENIPLFAINGISVVLVLFSFDWFFQGIENYRYIAVRSVIIKLVSVFLIISLVKKESDYLIYALFNVLGLSANYVFNFIYARKLVKINFHKLELRKHLQPLLRFALIIIATSLYGGLDKIFIGMISGDYYVGLYSPAEKMTRLSISLATAFSAVIVPSLSEAFAQGNHEKANSLIHDSIHVLIVLALPLFVGLELLAEPFILLLSGPSFAASITTLRIEALIVIPVILASAAGPQILVCSNREGKFLLAIIGGAIAFAIVALALIPSMRQNGAAIGMVCAETAAAILEMIFARDFIQIKRILSWMLPILTATIVMAALVGSLLFLHLHPIILVVLSISLGAAAYFGILWLMKDSIAEKAIIKFLPILKRRGASL